MNIKVGQSYFIHLPVGNLDGTIDLESWKPTYCDSIEEALQYATEGTRSEGMTEVVFECRPVYKVTRGPVKVTKFKLRD